MGKRKSYSEKSGDDLNLWRRWRKLIKTLELFASGFDGLAVVADKGGHPFEKFLQ